MFNSQRLILGIAGEDIGPFDIIEMREDNKLYRATPGGKTMEEKVQVGTVEKALVALSLFTPYEIQLQELEEFNKGIVFDYRDKKENEAARRLVFKYRKLKAATDRARKARKSEIDTAGKALVSRIEELIEVHDTPLKEEKKRVDDIQCIIVEMGDLVTRCSEYESSEDIEDSIAALNHYNVDESFEEFRGQADKVKEDGLKILSEFEVIALNREAEKAELECFRKAEQERLQEKARMEREEEEKRRMKATPEVQNTLDLQAPTIPESMPGVFVEPKGEKPPPPWAKEIQADSTPPEATDILTRSTRILNRIRSEFGVSPSAVFLGKYEERELRESPDYPITVKDKDLLNLSFFFTGEDTGLHFGISEGDL